jgi:FG-GAP repeat
VNKCLIICFTIFSIVIPIGTQPQLESNYAFAEINSQSINDDEVEYTDEDRDSSYSSTSETRSKLNVKDPFGSLPDTRYSNTNINQSNNTNNDNSNDILSLEKTTSTESSSTSSSQTSQAESSNEVYGDFNGDGFDDLAIGVQQENIGAVSDAGAVNVIYGSSNGLSATSPIPDQFWTQDTSNVNDLVEEGDIFGNALSSGDFNGDGFDDLAIGVPLEDVVTETRGTQFNAGAVNVLYGSSSGLSATSPIPDQFWTQDTSNVQDLAEGDDFFGTVLSSGDFNGDGSDDLAIGVPFEDVDTGGGTIFNAGAVNVIYGSSNGLSATSPIPDQFWAQETPSVNDPSELQENFGHALSSGDFNGDGSDDLAIGVPAEDVDTGGGTITSAGAVNVIYGSLSGLSATSPRSDQFWTQDTSNVQDLAEELDFFGTVLSSGDFNGDGFDDLAIGVPTEDVDTGGGTISDAGAVNVIYGSLSGLSATSPRSDQFWAQETPSVNDPSELEDTFGNALSSGDFNDDGIDDLAIGVKFEDVLGLGDDQAGAVNVIYGSSTGLSATSPLPDQFWTQNAASVNDLSESNDNFGFSLYASDFNGDGIDDLAIGVPFEDLGPGGTPITDTGAVNVIYGSSTGLSATSPLPDQFWGQDTANVNDPSESSDNFGFALG